MILTENSILSAIGDTLNLCCFKVIQGFHSPEVTEFPDFSTTLQTKIKPCYQPETIYGVCGACSPDNFQNYVWLLKNEFHATKFPNLSVILEIL